MSGFGLDPSNGRVTADILAWEEYLKGKPEFEKWRTKLCPRCDDLEAIIENDSATGDCAVTGNDNFFPIHEENVNEVDGQNDSMDQSEVRAPKRNIEGGTNKIRRRRTQPYEHESLIALSSIAEYESH